ncbi:MAG: DUF896 domain-containing protein [Peptostreptococcaceae bacterium]|nr:DUF896 domain-containing protein [Peptostreptococcaceae bacterium]
MLIKEIPRINELARLSKERELTMEEKAEQAELRKKYLEAVRGSAREILLHSTVKDPDGNDVTPQKLREAQARSEQTKS